MLDLGPNVTGIPSLGLHFLNVILCFCVRVASFLTDNGVQHLLNVGRHVTGIAERQACSLYVTELATNSDHIVHDLLGWKEYRIFHVSSTVNKYFNTFLLHQVVSINSVATIRTVQNFECIQFCLALISYPDSNIHSNLQPSPWYNVAFIF